MQSYVPKRKPLLITISMIYTIILAAYISYHFSQTMGYYTQLQPTYANVIAQLIALAIVAISIYTKRLILGFTIYLTFLYIVFDVFGLMTGGSLAFYAGGAVPVALAGIICAVGYVLARHIRVKSYSVRLPGLQQPTRIALISDMHIGTNIRERDFPRIVEQINSLDADLVMFCGDIYEERTRMEQYKASLEAFKQIRAEKYYVLGNHEYAAMKQGSMSMNRLRSDLAAAGVKSLKDESVQAKGFTIIGRDDPAHNRKDLATLLAKADDKPVVVLDHHPSDYANASKLGIGLMLSGHTHGGQLFPLGRLGELLGHGELMYGHRSFGNTHAIVSSGIGTWGFPMRIGMPSEITLVDVSPE